MDNNMDLSKIKQAAEQISSDDFANQETKVIGGDLGSVLKQSGDNKQPVPVQDEEVLNDMDLTPIEGTPDVPDVYEGPGLVISDDEFKAEPEPVQRKFTGLSKATEDYVASYLQEMDAEIEDLKEEHEAIVEAKEKEASDEDDAVNENEMTKDEFEEKYNEAIVIIDKSNFGTVIDFTDEEREKLEKSRKIKLEEVETISLETIKTKKIRKKSEFDKIIKKVTNIHTTSIVLPISGYTATMKGCSAYELISLLDGNNNALLDAQNKWSLIHSKIESTSIGNMSFNDFLLNTAASDYNVFIYGILCSTYPDDDTIPLTCEKCKKEFSHAYSVKSLIRVEAMKERLRDAIMTIVDSSVSEETAKVAHEKAPISQLHRVKLPSSGIIAEIYVQTAYDLINKSIKDLAEKQDPKYSTAAILSTLIRTFYVPDPEEPGSYFEVDGAGDIAKTLYTLNEVDIMIIRRFGENMLEDLNMEFGLMGITCPACNHYTPTLEMDLESILFYRYRQAMTSKIE